MFIKKKSKNPKIIFTFINKGSHKSHIISCFQAKYILSAFLLFLLIFASSSFLNYYHYQKAKKLSGALFSLRSNLVKDAENDSTIFAQISDLQTNKISSDSIAKEIQYSEKTCDKNNNICCQNKEYCFETSKLQYTAGLLKIDIKILKGNKFLDNIKKSWLIIGFETKKGTKFNINSNIKHNKPLPLDKNKNLKLFSKIKIPGYKKIKIKRLWFVTQYKSGKEDLYSLTESATQQGKTKGVSL